MGEKKEHIPRPGPNQFAALIAQLQSADAIYS